MVFNENAEPFGLLSKKARISNVPVAWTGTTGRMIVREDQSSRIQVQGPSEKLSR
jgi:hypothetical protein